MDTLLTKPPVWHSAFSQDVTAEQHLIQWLSYAMIAWAAFAAVALQFTPAPYGKYSTSAAWFYGPSIPGKLSWFLQELPCLLVIVFAWVVSITTSPNRFPVLETLSPNTVLLCLLALHYANRVLVFPFRLRGGKPTPIVVFLLAAISTAWIG
jgi:3-oxo-5-alpha-steroid 4-dehydrogenase 1